MTDPAVLSGARAAPMAEMASPELATLSASAPDGPNWAHEIKYDGYRLLVSVAGDRARAVSRRGLDYSDRCRPVLEAARRLPVGEVWLDGELVVMGEDGRTDFQALQNALGRGESGSLTYVVFDLLHLDGYDLRAVALEARKAALAARMTTEPAACLRYGRHVIGRGPAFFTEACRLGLEGIVSKRLDAPYRAGRHRDWLKIKCRRSTDAVVGGFTEPEGGRMGLGALLVGGYDAEGCLRYAGKVGTGFTDATLEDLRGRLEALEVERSPFGDGLPRLVARKSRFVRPVLVARIAYGSVTEEGFLRHASFAGLREDRVAREVAAPGRGLGPV